MADDKKKILIEKAIHAGLGTEKFLEGVSLENLETMVKTVEERDGEIEVLKKTQKKEEPKSNSTTVADLVKGKKIKVRPVEEEVSVKSEEKPKDKKDGKDAS